MDKKIISGETDTVQFQFKIGWTKFSGQKPYFSITGETWELGKPKIDKYMISCGALTLGEYVPELGHLDKYHLMSTEMPMHYVSNALYLASDRDCWGLRKGEKRQIKNGKTGKLAWHLVGVHKVTGLEVELHELKKSVDADAAPECDYNLEYRPWCRIGEGKERDLAGARRAAVWPDAELEDFTEEKLIARLPDLMKQFRSDLEAAGIPWPEGE